MAQLLHLPMLKSSSSSSSCSRPPLHLHCLHLQSQPHHLLHSSPCSVLFHPQARISHHPLILRSPVSLSPFACNFSGSDIIPQLELEKPEQRRKPEKRVNGVFWIILLNLGIFVADHIIQLVEEEEGNLALWLSYILTGAGANLVSWLVLPRNVVSVGASGAVFGLFAISVFVKMSWDWRKILEVLILGQFVIERVMEAAQASAGMANGLVGGYSVQTVNHIAHLSGALVGVLLVWLLSLAPSPPETDNSSSTKKP